MNNTDRTTQLHRADADEAIRAAAEWLLSMQKSDGDFALLRDTAGELSDRIDRPRSALAGLACALYGVATGDARHIEAARRNMTCLEALMSSDPAMAHVSLVRSYVGQTAAVLGDRERVLALAHSLVERLDDASYEPIPFQHVATFLCIASFADRAYLPISARYADRVYVDIGDIERGILHAYPAHYAELVHSFFLLHRRTGNRAYLRAAQRVYRWIDSFRMDSGGFRTSDDPARANVRGVGKIFEIVGLAGIASKKELDGIGLDGAIANGCFDQLVHAQYKKDDERMVGGFRHTFEDPSAWVDAAAHFLIGAIRLRDRVGYDFLSWRSDTLTAYRPFVVSPAVMRDMPADNRAYRFFAIRSSIERLLARLIFFVVDHGRAVVRELPAMLPERNDAMRNYAYVLRHLFRAGVIRAKTFREAVVHKSFPNTGGHFSVDPVMHMGADMTDGLVESVGYAHGFSTEWHVAMGQAVGEILERYPYATYRAIEFPLMSVNDARIKGSIDLSALVRFSTEQQERAMRRMWGGDSLFRWTTVRRVGTGKRLLAPAQLIYWNYRTESDEPRLRESNTSGLGGAFTYSGAVLAALYELIERDAFFVHWLSGVAPMRIDPSTISDAALLERYTDAVARGFEVHFLFAATDVGVPVFFTVIHDRDHAGPCYVLGGGCNCDPIRALRRSFDEAWSIYFWARSSFAGSYGSLPQPYEPFYTKLTIGERISLWGNRDMRDAMKPFLSADLVSLHSIKSAHFGSERAELEYLVGRVESLGSGYEVYVHEGAHPVLRQLGYHAVRAIVPQLAPMYYREENAPLENPRVYAFAEQHGRAAAKPNPIPHPFP